MPLYCFDDTSPGGCLSSPMTVGFLSLDGKPYLVGATPLRFGIIAAKNLHSFTAIFSLIIQMPQKGA